MKKVPANRVAALGAAAAAIAAGVVSVISAVDSWPRAVVLVAALAVVGAVAVVFLRGAQKDEARKARYQPPVIRTGTSATYSAQGQAYGANPNPQLDPEFTPDPAPPKADPSVAQSHLDGGAA